MPRKAAPHLLVNLNNSFTKVALATAEKVGPIRRLPTPELTSGRLRALLAGWRYDRAVLASVVPARSDAVRVAVKGPLLEVSHRLDLGVGIAYPKPASIGADRLANAAAALHYFGAPSVVVDFGTALTFDVISPEGAYVGGVIAPGLASMTEYLHQRTALLPSIHLLEPPRAVGRTTRQAMLSGAVHGYRGLVREILHKIRAEMCPRRALRVVSTGGYAGLIAAGLPEIRPVHPTLTMEGLRLIANRNA